MVNLFRYWWKQLDGPQITAIMQATFLYIKNQINGTLEYFRTFSVDTATDTHCTLIGVLMGLSRPIMTQEQVKNFWFTDGPSKSEEPGEYHGLSSLGPFVTTEGDNVPPLTGGRFTDLYAEGDVMEDVYLPIKYWRSLLKLVSQSEGYPGSLKVLDEVVLWFYETYRPSIDPDYIIEIDETGDDARSIGDINLHIGKLTYWMEYAPFIYGALDSLQQSYYSPMPQLHIIFNYASNVWEQLTDENLADMWAGTPEIDEDVGIGFEMLTETNLVDMWAGTFDVPEDIELAGFEYITHQDIIDMFDGTYTE